MHRNGILIILLLAIVIAAPIVDAIACDDCKDIVPLRDQQSLVNGADNSDNKLLSSDAGSSDSQGAATAQDLCPVCANIAAALENACCEAPSMISHANHHPKLTALSDPSYSITKPPQN
jgi:hypothetical protein